MAAPTAAEFAEVFGQGGKELGPDVLSELQSISRLHQLSAQDLFFKWESYCIKMDMEGNKLSISTARALKQDVQDALERNNRAQNLKAEKRAGGTPRTAFKANGGDVFGMIDGLVPNTPGTGKLSKAASLRRKALETPSVARVKAEPPSSSPDFKTPARMEDQLHALGAIPPSSFNDRQNAGEVTEILNEHLPAAEPPIAPFAESRIKLTATSDQKKLGYKTLAMKMSEAADILDDRIEEFATLVQEFHGLEDSAFGSAAHQGTAEVVAVGRVCSDAADGAAKLGPSSLLLESSRRMGNGLRIPLNLSRLAGAFALFPGQIVAMRGTNTSGSEFVATKFLDVPLLPNAASTPQALLQHRDRLRGGPDAMDSDSDPLPLSVVFASGPYTADDNLDFEPLHTLCSAAGDASVDAVVLLGPFLDAEHPMVATGDFDLPDDAVAEPDAATMATVFKHTVSPALARLAQANPSVTILLVPSVRDVVAKHVSWPQEAFPRKDLGLPKQARIVGNPMTLSVNEVVLGLSSQDVFFELRHEEMVGARPREGDADLFSRLARYLVQQRHYFPLFPPVDRTKLPKTGTADGTPPGAMLDISYLKIGEMLNVRPDVLVLPSSLPPFAKVVESVLVINPGYLSKRRGAGTYARMTLQPPKVTDEELQDGGMVSHKVFDRARVEITRI